MTEPFSLRKRAPAYALSLLFLLVPLLLFKILNERLMKSPLGYDEQLFAWGGWSITQGLRPYLDFLEFKPPMVFITHAFAIAINGDQGTRFRIFFSVFAAVSIFALHLSLLSRRMNRLLTTLLVSALVLAWVNPSFHDNALQDSESIGLSYYFLGVAALIADTGRYRKYFEIAGGALLTCTVLSKEPYAGAVIGTWASAFFFVYGTESIKAGAIKYLTRTWLGVAAVIAALCVYMVPTGAMAGYIRMAAGYEAMFRDPKTSFCVLLGRWKPLPPLQTLQAQATYIYRQFFNLSTIGYLIPLLVASAGFIFKQSKALFISCIATFVLALYSVTATNCQWPHYYNMALSGMFFFMIAGADGFSAWLARQWWLVRTGVLVFILGIISIYAIPRVRTEIAGRPYRFSPASSNEPVLGAFDFVARNSAPGDTIVTTGAPLVYMYTHRRSAVREGVLFDEYIDYNSGNSDLEKLSGVRDELIRNRPRIVIIDPEFSARQLRYMKALFRPFLEEFNYRPVGPYYYVRPD